MKRIKGTSKILFFTAPYCSVCREIKSDVYATAAAAGVPVVEVNTSTSEGRAEGDRYGVWMLPVVIVLSDDGTTKYKGEKKEDILRDLPKALGQPGKNPYIPPTSEVSQKLIVGIVAAAGVFIFTELMKFGTNKVKKANNIEW